MLVRDIMTREVHTCHPDDSLVAAAKIMLEADCGCVPVVEAAHGRILGMITDRDICIAALLSGLPLRVLRIDSIMEGPVHTCSPDDDITRAESTMRHAQIRRLPVVNGNRQVVGILSLNDIARATEREGQRDGVLPKEVVAVLTAISDPHAAGEPAGNRACPPP